MSNPIWTNIFHKIPCKQIIFIYTAFCVYYYPLLGPFHIYCNRKQKPLDPLSHIRMCILSSTGIIIKSTVALTMLCGHHTTSHPSNRFHLDVNLPPGRHIKCPANELTIGHWATKTPELRLKRVVCASLHTFLQNHFSFTLAIAK